MPVKRSSYRSLLALMLGLFKMLCTPSPVAERDELGAGAV